jgi:hypothetical protein
MLAPRTPFRHEANTLAALAAGVLCLALGGCISTADRSEMAKSESVLAPLFKQMSPADAAAWAADPYDADKRARGMNMLANAPFGGADAYLALYRERLKDDHAPVRATACRALGLHGSSDDVPLIVPLTKSDDVAVRLEAVRALQRLHNPAAIPALIERTQMERRKVDAANAEVTPLEPDAQIRAEAASALGQYADASVLQVLISALDDRSLLVNKAAYTSLKTLTGNDDLPAERKPWFAWVKATDKPFAGQRPYVYPVFWREKGWLDYIPFASPVPNEVASTPVGFSLEQGSSAPAPAPAPDKKGG